MLRFCYVLLLDLFTWFVYLVYGLGWVVILWCIGMVFVVVFVVVNSVPGVDFGLLPMLVICSVAALLQLSCCWFCLLSAAVGWLTWCVCCW